MRTENKRHFQTLILSSKSQKDARSIKTELQHKGEAKNPRIGGIGDAKMAAGGGRNSRSKNSGILIF
jgi:hypothetical protein